MKNVEYKIKAEPFSWKDKMGEVALEDFSFYQKDMSYGASQTIGIALAKLQIMEEQGLYPDMLQEIVQRLEQQAKQYRRRQKEHESKNMTVQISDKYFGKACSYEHAIEIIKEVGGINDRTGSIQEFEKSV